VSIKAGPSAPFSSACPDLVRQLLPTATQYKRSTRKESESADSRCRIYLRSVISTPPISVTVATIAISVAVPSVTERVSTVAISVAVPSVTERVSTVAISVAVPLVTERVSVAVSCSKGQSNGTNC
jgi:hypothetical protein